MFVTGLVLAAGGSRRLGRPKLLLPFRGRTLLDATLDRARACGFDQMLVVLGGAAEDVRATVDLRDAEVVENQDFGDGCSTSIARSLERVDDRSDGVVMLLGDQPETSPATVRALVTAAERGAVAVCRYEDGRGHPFWFGRDAFAELRQMHGDKAVWKVLESGSLPVTEVDAEGTIPLDVDTWDDYETLLVRDRARIEA